MAAERQQGTPSLFGSEDEAMVASQWENEDDTMLTTQWENEVLDAHQQRLDEAEDALIRPVRRRGVKRVLDSDTDDEAGEGDQPGTAVGHGQDAQNCPCRPDVAGASSDTWMSRDCIAYDIERRARDRRALNRSIARQRDEEYATEMEALRARREQLRREMLPIELRGMIRRRILPEETTSEETTSTETARSTLTTTDLEGYTTTDDQGSSNAD